MDFDYGIEAILTDLSLVSSTSQCNGKKEELAKKWDGGFLWGLLQKWGTPLNSSDILTQCNCSH